MWQHASVADIAEKPLVELVINSPIWRWRLLNIAGIDAASTLYPCVQRTGLPRFPAGDIDLLLVPPSRPDHATAIEFKRVKIRDGEANKLHEFTKGVDQVNRLAMIGFYQVYLYILVAVDSRATNEGQMSCADGIGWELRNEIAARISPRDLQPGVGLMQWEFVQSTDHAPLGVGHGGGHLVRLAEPRAQSVEVTAWVARVHAAGTP